VSAFPSEIQSSVSAQVADSLVAVVCQRLRFRPELNIRVPECEILIATHAVKNFIRNRDFFKIVSAIEAGGEHGMWSFQRYRTWLDNRSKWHIPGQNVDSAETETVEPDPPLPAPIAPSPKPVKPEIRLSLPPRESDNKKPSRIEIEPVEGDFGKILKRPGEQ
jgi:twitching motility protein PilT